MAAAAAAASAPAVRWHADGLVFEGVEGFALARQGNDVFVCETKATVHSPATPIDGVFGLYSLPSGPYVALVLESEALNECLRKVTKIGLAPVCQLRLNSQLRADEALEVGLLSKALREHPWVFSPRSLATRCVLRQDEDDEFEDERFFWNRVALQRIPRAWGLACACAVASPVADIEGGRNVFLISRIACDSLSSGYGQGVNLVETELMMEHRSFVFVRCSLLDLTIAFVDALLADYGGKTATFVMDIGERRLRAQAADLASLRNGGKVRVVVITQNDVSAVATAVELASSAGFLVFARSPATDEAVLFGAQQIIGEESEEFESIYADHAARLASLLKSPSAGIFSGLSDVASSVLEGPRADATQLLLLGGAEDPKKRRFLGAATPVHPLERVDVFAAKVILLFSAIFFVLPKEAPLRAKANVALLILLQALVIAFGAQLYDGRLAKSLALTSRFFLLL